MRRTLPRLALAMLAALVLCSGCAPGSGSFAGPPHAHVGPPVSYLDVFDQSTIPTEGTSSYQQALIERALPEWTTSYEAVGLGDERDPIRTIEEAMTLTASVSPTVVTICSGMSGVFAGVSRQRFAAALSALLSRLRALHTTTILVATLLPLDQAPIYAVGNAMVPSLLATRIDRYDAAIVALARRYHAVVVDLHGAFENAIARHGVPALFSPDHYGVTALGSRVIDRTFLSAIRGRPVNVEGSKAR